MAVRGDELLEAADQAGGVLVVVVVAGTVVAGSVVAGPDGVAVVRVAGGGPVVRVRAGLVGAVRVRVVVASLDHGASVAGSPAAVARGTTYRDRTAARAATLAVLRGV